MATILIADDDPVVREVAGEMLRSTGHAAVLAENGLQVMTLLDRLQVDLLVTDMLMPGMDGFEVIMQARARRPSLKILAISAGGGIGVDYLLHTAKILGAQAVLEKPLRVVTFIQAINDLLVDQPERPAATFRQRAEARLR